MTQQHKKQGEDGSENATHQVNERCKGLEIIFPDLSEHPLKSTGKASENKTLTPAHDSIEIQFSLFHAAKVLIEIFDITGRVIHKITDKQLDKGDHRIQWNKNETSPFLPIGTYLLILKTMDAENSFMQSEVFNVS